MLLARREQWLRPTIERFRARGHACEGAVCDVSDPAAVQRVVESMDRVDILVNNAGVTWGQPAEEMPLDKWQVVLDVNLTGAFLFCQAAGKRMIAQGSGCIINVASVAGLVAMPSGIHSAGYAASKGGLLALTRELAAKWTKHGIRVT